MLKDFFNKKKKANIVKTTNIAQIQELCASLDTNNTPLNKLVHINKNDRKALCKKKIQSKETNQKRQKIEIEVFKTASNLLSVSRTLQYHTDNPITTNHIEKPFKNELGSNIPESDIELRKINVMNAASRNIEIKYGQVSAELYLPKSFKIVSSLYKVLSSVYSFNQRRGLALILEKYTDSIERLFKRRLETSLLEQLNFICNDAISFTPLTITDEGIKKKTFKVDMKTDFDIDIALFNYYCEKYKEWLEVSEICGKVLRIHPDFIKKDIEVPRKAFQLKDKEEEEKAPAHVAKIKAESIIERIKEKERIRKEMFIRECTEKVDYASKIDVLFSLSGKHALKLADIVFKLGGIDTRARVLKALGEKYIVKIINDEDYVVKIG
ncbi:hypothetical protein GINT2_000564 [Glugoides intestinalis]